MEVTVHFRPAIRSNLHDSDWMIVVIKWRCQLVRQKEESGYFCPKLSVTLQVIVLLLSFSSSKDRIPATSSLQCSSTCEAMPPLKPSGIFQGLSTASHHCILNHVFLWPQSSISGMYYLGKRGFSLPGGWLTLPRVIYSIFSWKEKKCWNSDSSSYSCLRLPLSLCFKLTFIGE